MSGKRQTSLVFLTTGSLFLFFLSGTAFSDEKTLVFGEVPSGVAGEFFGVPVSLDNYHFAKRVAYTFQRPWESGRTPEETEEAIWENLILSYEAYRRNLEVTDEELDEWIGKFLKGQEVAFVHTEEPETYARWVKETLNADIPFFENQMRYLYQIEKLKRTVRESFEPEVTEEEMRQEFLNEKHHVGGEFAVFETREEAEAFYQKMKDPERWETRKKKEPGLIRPFSIITLEAIIDLWGMSKEEAYELHALDVGEVSRPLPFGRKFGVYHLLDKRTGDLKDFPGEREAYRRQLTLKKQYEALKAWIADLKERADLKVFVGNP